MKENTKLKNDPYKERSILMIVLAISIFLIFVARLFYLQILNPEYKRQAYQNAFYLRPIYPERGAIFDRNNEIIVYNEPAYDLQVTTNELLPFDTLALCQLLGTDKSTLLEHFQQITNRKKNPAYSPYSPQTLLPHLPISKVAPFREQLYRFPGFSVIRRSVRKYNSTHAALLLGYMGECNPIELQNDSLLSVGDYVGKTGVERTYEHVLRGKKGTELLLRDAVGKIQGKYKQGSYDTPAEAGKNIILSIDMELQAFGEELMRGKQGAIVAIEPKTGEILALVSSPSFDPALLSGRGLGENFRMLQTAADKPLYNRAIMGTYPPGSTFKITQAAILLHQGVITPQTLYTCNGGYPLLGRRPRCHAHGSPLGVSYAIATSCNAFFCWGLHYLIDDRRYFPSVQEAFEAWKNDIVAMGYGYKLGIDLPGEKRGYIPNSKVYDKIYRKRWASSNIISIAIGQGEVTATPLQIANLAATVANRGYFYTPHVVREIQGGELDSLYTTKHDTGIPAQHWEVIAEGMARAVTSGTCGRANFAPGEIEVCGKTGTAENPSGRDHSSFMGFAPRYNPQIAIAVYVENGGFGAHFGVPIGSLMMEFYLRNGQLSAYSKGLAESMKHRSITYINAY